jgi:hypothetical protein
MLHLVLVDLFNSEIVDHQGERWSCLVTPQAGGIFTLVIPKQCKFAAEVSVC